MDYSEYFIGTVYDVCRTECFQFGARAEAPRHSAGGDSRIGGCLHVYARVAYIEHLLSGYVRRVQDVVYDGGVGLHVDAFALPEDGGEADAGEVVGYQFAGSSLVFVGRYCRLDAFRLQLLQQFRYAGIYRKSKRLKTSQQA